MTVKNVMEPKDSASINARFTLNSPDNRLFGQATQSFSFAGDANARTIDREFVLCATNGPPDIADTKEGTAAGESSGLCFSHQSITSSARHRRFSSQWPLGSCCGTPHVRLQDAHRIPIHRGNNCIKSFESLVTARFTGGTALNSIFGIALRYFVLLHLTVLFAFTQSSIQTVKVGTPLSLTRVPTALQQGSFLPKQSVSALDISDDGRFIAVTTMAFRNDRNFWLISSQGKSLEGHYVLPWAPFEAAVLPGGHAFGVGLAYSLLTSPAPTISLFERGGINEKLLEGDGHCFSCQLGWMTYGSGNWRNGWIVNIIGDLLVRTRDSVFTVGAADGAWRLSQDGTRRNYSGSLQRPFRMASSADGASLVSGYIATDPAALDETTRKVLNVSRTVLAVRGSNAQENSWSVPALLDEQVPGKLPDPAGEFPTLADNFHMRADALVPFRVAASVAVSSDASKVAIAEYGGWLWVSNRPPDAGVVPFLPHQRGYLRIFEASGRETERVPLPKEGLFEIKMDLRGSTLWCVPMKWFARGAAGRPWLPTDQDARTVFVYDLIHNSWRTALQFPDAISDLALRPERNSALVSCWDGQLYLVSADGAWHARSNLHGPALVRWNTNGSFAVVGVPGEIARLDATGRVSWRLQLTTSTKAQDVRPSLRQVFERLPIYSVGHAGPEAAYAGDTWLIKTNRGGILVDAGGASGIPITLEKVRAAGLYPRELAYLIHTHGHGDHTGAGYLWRAMGLKVVAAESAAFNLSWMMPLQAGYGLWVPRPLDIALPLKRAGDETEVTLCGLRIRALFAPGHSVDSVIYMVELNGKRVVFTGDIGFSAANNILNRCWGDPDKAKIVKELVRSKLIPWHPDFVFTGHGSHDDGTQFLEQLVRTAGV